MKKVLVISYTYPPTGGAGIARIVKFVKYLRAYGWEPIVLTVKNPSTPIEDLSWTDDLPPGITVYKARTFEPSYKMKSSLPSNVGQGESVGGFKRLIKKLFSHLLIPDAQVLWWPGMVLCLIRVIRKEKIDCIFVTAPPFSQLIPPTVIGGLFRIPVVADFRDEWPFARNNLENASNNRIIKFMDQVLERFVLNRSTKFVTVTDAYLQGIQERHPTVNIDKGVVIRNGFDQGDFSVESSVAGIKTGIDSIELKYVGTVWKATSLRKFFDALNEVRVSMPELAKRLRIKVVGRVVPQEMDYLAQEKLVQNIEVTGYLSHKEVVKEMTEADILLLTLSNAAHASRIVPQKMYEYMATGNHILAIIPEGEASSILSRYYPNVTLVNNDQTQSISQGIVNALKYCKKIAPPDTLKAFERNHLTEALAKVLNAAIR